MTEDVERDALADAYDKGFIDALRCFAVWRDGEEHVGSGFLTLKKAIEQRTELTYYDPPIREERTT